MIVKLHLSHKIEQLFLLLSLNSECGSPTTNKTWSQGFQIVEAHFSYASGTSSLHHAQPGALIQSPHFLCTGQSRFIETTHIK